MTRKKRRQVTLVPLHSVRKLSLLRAVHAELAQTPKAQISKGTMFLATATTFYAKPVSLESKVELSASPALIWT
jgi:hypothetical protein